MLKTNIANFEGSDYDQAVQKAEKHFKISKESLEITVIEDNSSNGLFKKKVVKISASIKGEQSEEGVNSDNEDLDLSKPKVKYFDRSDFLLSYRDDGVHLKLAEDVKSLSSKRKMDILDYINRKQIKELNSKLIIPILSGSYRMSLKQEDGTETDESIIAEQFGEVIAPPQKEEYARAKILVLTKNRYLNAFIKLSYPDELATPITTEEILEALESERIVHGVAMEKIVSFVENPVYNTEFLVANGDLPITGEDAKIVILFNTEHEGKAKTDDRQKVDFWSLDLFESTEEGQELIRKTPAQEGTDGKTVYGDILPANKGKDKRIPIGKNTAISEDGLILYATCAGKVDIVNDRVNVSSSLDIKSNVDLSVGNLEFDGDINITGNVIAGITIKATGNVTIGGAVAASKIFAGKNIIVRGGMNGGFKGELHAENVFSKFLEQTTVVVKNNVVSEYILDCNVSAGNAIKALKGRGLILSGKARAGKYIAALFIGNSYNIITNVQIGIDTSVCQTLENKILQLEQQSKSVSMLLSQAVTRPDLFTKEKIAQVKITLHNYQEQIQTCLKQIESTRQANKFAQKNGKIHIFKSIHPGVSVGIGENKTMISRENKYCTYKNSDGDLMFLECEGSLEELMRD